jgi:hypothetical protein
VVPRCDRDEGCKRDRGKRDGDRPEPRMLSYAYRRTSVIVASETTATIPLR